MNGRCAFRSVGLIRMFEQKLAFAKVLRFRSILGVGRASRQIRGRRGQVRPGNVENAAAMRTQQAARRARAQRSLQTRRRRGISRLRTPARD